MIVRREIEIRELLDELDERFRPQSGGRGMRPRARQGLLQQHAVAAVETEAAVQGVRAA